MLLAALVILYLAWSPKEGTEPTVRDPRPEEAPDGFGKLVLNLLDLSAESLPRGGDLALSFQPGEGKLAIQVQASGRDCQLRADCQDGLVPDPDVGELTPRNVQGYFTRLLARRLGGDLTFESPGPDSMTFTAELPLAA